MFKSIRLRLYPNQNQAQSLAQNAGSARFVYNHFLDKKIEHYKRCGKSLSFAECCKQLTALKREKQFVWLNDCDSTALQQSLKNLDTAYKGFFKHGRGFPKFKSKHRSRESFRCVMSITSDDNYLKCGKLGWIKTRGRYELLANTKINSITVSNDCGKWYASCLIESDSEVSNHCHKYDTCGIDVGVARPLTVAYTSSTGQLKYVETGKKFSKNLRVLELRTERYQRQMSRKKLGSANRAKAKKKLQNAYQKERNLRKEFVEQTSFKLASLFQTVKFEDLKIQKMTEGKSAKLNRSMRRLGLGALVTRTQQKADERNGLVLFVNPAYTSQTCRSCGSVDKRNRKSQSRFCCIDCGHTDNADRNAAANILYKMAA